ncbi:MAG: hypothetical protein U1C73_07070 [Dietzia sp.]|nr:hypothetical protein [Dietzia sp.]
MVEALVGVVDDQLQPLAEAHADHVVVVLRFERLEQWLGAHLAELALGLGIDAAHRALLA